MFSLAGHGHKRLTATQQSHYLSPAGVTMTELY
jgi:hypothetical protein